MIERVLQQIKEIKNTDELFYALADLFNAAKNILQDEHLKPGELHELIACSTEIRLLITELYHLEQNAGEERPSVASLNYLRECYLHLEGLVKEKRNDLCRNTHDISPQSPGHNTRSCSKID